MPPQLERYNPIEINTQHTYNLDLNALPPREAARYIAIAPNGENLEELGDVGFRFAVTSDISKTEVVGNMVILPDSEVTTYGIEAAIHRAQIESTTQFFGKEKELWTKLATKHPLIVQEMIAYGILGRNAYDRNGSSGFNNIPGHNMLVAAAVDEMLLLYNSPPNERSFYQSKAFKHDAGKRGEISFLRVKSAEEIARRIKQIHSDYYKDGNGIYIHDDPSRMTGVDFTGIEQKPLPWQILRFADSIVDGSQYTSDWRIRIDNLKQREHSKFKVTDGGLVPNNIVAEQIYKGTFLGEPVTDYYDDVLKRATAFCEHKLFTSLSDEKKVEIGQPENLLPYLLHRLETNPAILTN